MSEFAYLARKIENAPFDDFPFRHILIKDFFTPEHFARIVSARQVRLPECSNTCDLIDRLAGLGYEPIEFPRCTTDLAEYIACAEGRKRFDTFKVKGYGRSVIEGYGVTMRLGHYEGRFPEDLIGYFNSREFAGVLAEKFGLEREYTIETGLQKNLKHYEISPHPDTSRKALTYMVNIHTDPDSAAKDMHTRFCRLIDRYAYLYDFWKHNDVDPVWVPWSWAETARQANSNNSISIFRPAHDTLHAVRAMAGDKVHQRNQIYGNLWYAEPQKRGSLPWQALDLVSNIDESRIKRIVRKMLV